jgi:uncharacterized membrane protein
MRCHSCQQDNAESNLFCIFCGILLHIDAEFPNHSDETSTSTDSEDADSVSELRKDVRQLQGQVRGIYSILSNYDARLSSPPVAGIGNRMASTTEKPARSRPVFWERFDWEPILGGNWLARIGILAVVIGAGFFFKLAFDNDWIVEEGRVVLGIAGGLALLGASEYWHKRYPVYAQALAGGSISVLYLSFFSAFALYDLIGFYPAVASLLIISCTSAALALRHDSMALALIGISGAFVAPFILSGFAKETSGNLLSSRSYQLIGYIIAVDIGVVILSVYRSWRWFTLLALLGSLTSYGAWYGEYSESASHLTAEGSLTIIFLIFVGATTLFHFVWRRAPQVADFTLMVINASAYLGISYGILWDDYREWMGGFTLLLSLFYVGLSYIALQRVKKHIHLAVMSLVIGLVFLAVAVPVQLEGAWIGVAWAVLGTVIMVASFSLRMWQLRVFSIGIFVIMVVRLLAFDTYSSDLSDFQVILNNRMLVFASGISALYLAAHKVKSGLNALPGQDYSVRATATPSFGSGFSYLTSVIGNDLKRLSYSQSLFPALVLGANFLTIWIMSAEVIATVDSDIVDLSRRTERHITSLSLSLLWAVYAGSVLTIGIVKRWQPVRLGGLALLAIPVGKLFLVDTFNLEQGYRVAAYLSLGFMLLIGGFLYQRFGAAIKEFLFEEQTSSHK